jgi:hypothetical protein
MKNCAMIGTNTFLYLPAKKNSLPMPPFWLSKQATQLTFGVIWETDTILCSSLVLQLQAQ